QTVTEVPLESQSARRHRDEPELRVALLCWRLRFRLRLGLLSESGYGRQKQREQCCANDERRFGLHRCGHGLLKAPIAFRHEKDPTERRAVMPVATIVPPTTTHTSTDELADVQRLRASCDAARTSCWGCRHCIDRSTLNPMTNSDGLKSAYELAMERFKK